MGNRLATFLRRAKVLIMSVVSERPGDARQHPVYGFLHFWAFALRGFVRSRCPVRATALSYTTLLALVPLLAVSLGVSTSLLKSDQDQTRRMIEHLVNQVAPQLEQLPGSDREKLETRDQLIDYIQNFIANIHSGALGVTGTVALVLVAIGLLSTIEGSFNDIWGVPRGRSWFSRVIHYWTAITLGPLIVILAMGMAVSAELLTAPDKPPQSEVRSTSGTSDETLNAGSPTSGRPGEGDTAVAEGGLVDEARSAALRSLRTLARGPLGRLVLNLAPFIVLSLSFGLLYQLMPNTRVSWKAAFLGGMVGALLWILNSKFSVVFASRVVSASRIYGPLGVFPVFLIGMYISWLILLFGAQVSYTFQNRHAYLQDKRAEGVSQRGREFVAMRVMMLVAQRFYQGVSPPSVGDLAGDLGVSPRLVLQLIERLRRQNLLIEVNTPNPAFAPTRPLDRISTEEILEAVRAGEEHELPTRPGADRDVAYAAYTVVEQAERAAARPLTLLQFVERGPAGAAEKSGRV